MGSFKVKMELCGLKKCRTVDALVDTGGIDSAVSETLAEELGIPLLSRGTPFTTVKGSVMGRRGAAIVTVDGVEAWIPVVAFQEDMITLGATALEILRFKVNPVTQKLEKLPPGRM